MIGLRVALDECSKHVDSQSFIKKTFSSEKTMMFHNVSSRSQIAPCQGKCIEEREILALFNGMNFTTQVKIESEIILASTEEASQESS